VNCLFRISRLLSTCPPGVIDGVHEHNCRKWSQTSNLIVDESDDCCPAARKWIHISRHTLAWLPRVLHITEIPWRAERLPPRLMHA